MTLGIFTVIKPSLGSSPLEAPSKTDSFTKSLLPISFGVCSDTLGLLLDFDFSELDSDFSELDFDFSELDFDFSELDSDFSELDSDFSELDSDFSELDSDFSELDSDFPELDSDFSPLEVRIVEAAELVLFTVPSCTKLALKSTVFKEVSSGK